jgi:hypothetical protein
MIEHIYKCASVGLSYNYKIFFKHGHGTCEKFEMAPFSPIIADIIFVSIFRMRCVCTVRCLYFRIFRLLSLSHFSLLKNCNIVYFMYVFHYTR